MNVQPVIGNLQPCFAGLLAEVLDTGYESFETEAMQGLAKVTGLHIELLAIVSPQEGQGNFRRFIEELKQHYTTISVWEIFNPWLATKLADYGFIPAKARVDGEWLTGMKWHHPPLSESRQVKS